MLLPNRALTNSDLQKARLAINQEKKLTYQVLKYPKQ